jgi:hypothetical protein
VETELQLSREAEAAGVEDSFLARGLFRPAMQSLRRRRRSFQPGFFCGGGGRGARGSGSDSTLDFLFLQT